MRTDRLSPHFVRHAQWNVCMHGTVTRPVTEESMRSRQTGQVGNSYGSPGAESLAFANVTSSCASILMDVTRTI